MNRITNLAAQVLNKHKEKFGTDFAQNKKLLGQLAIIRSKALKNEMAGYITKLIKRENASKALKEERLAKEQAGVEEEQTEVEVEAQEEETEEESMPQEIVLENASEEP
ncbi:MAG: hypothetical protein WAO91_02255 [Candidatus Nitrosotenuis sp.]